MVTSERPASDKSIEGQNVVEHNVTHQSIEDQAPGGDAGALDVDSVVWAKQNAGKIRHR